MKKFILYPFLAVLPLANGFAGEKIVGCLHNLSTLSGPIEALNKELTSCGYNKGLAELEKVNEQQEKYVLEKLAAKLALQINQNSEETALLTGFFNSNGDDLLMKEADPEGIVKRECSLTQLKEIEKCGGVKKGPLFDMKLGLLKSKLNPTNKESKYGNSIFGILADKYASNLGISGFASKGNNLQCPLDGGVSGFILQSQLDGNAAQDIIDAVFKSTQNFNDKIDKYAQLKFIRDAGKIEEFKKYLGKFHSNKENGRSAKDYIAQFFKDKKNQKEFFVPTMANECSKITKNINRFLCSDLDELGSTNSKASIDLFNKLDVAPMADQYEIDFEKDEVALRAYGFQCLALAKSKAPKEFFKASGREQKLDDWYNDFTKNTRPEVSIDKDNDKNALFCANYTCSSKESKNAPSCKSGGPLLSSDLKKIMQCDQSPLGKKCDSDALKAIDYMASNEKVKFSMGIILGDNSSSSPSSEQVKKAKSSLPDFAENYLGVEGSLVALGQPVTPITVAEKTQDFKERNLNSETPSYKEPISNFANNESNSSNIVAENNWAPAIPTPAAFVPNTMSEHNNYSMKPIEGIRNSHKKGKEGAVSIGGQSENEKMVKDLKDLMDQYKNSDEEKIDDKKIVSSTSTAKDFSKSNYENELSSWAQRLANKDATLRDRENWANARDMEYWQKLEELRRREADLAARTSGKASEAAVARAPASALTGSVAKSSSKAAGEIKKARALLDNDLSASPTGLTVTPEKLEKLDKEDLKENHVNIDEPFVISVRLKSKLIHVRVAQLKNGKRTYLAPYLNDDNKEVKEAILKSPIFKEFRYYLEQQETAYSPVKKIKK